MSEVLLKQRLYQIGKRGNSGAIIQIPKTVMELSGLKHHDLMEVRAVVEDGKITVTYQADIKA